MTKLEIVGETEETGTQITFYPDGSIFEEIEFSFDIIKNRIKELAYLNKGLRMTVQDEREGKEKTETYKFDGGIKHFVENMNKNKEVLLPETFYFETINKDNEIEVALQYNNSYAETIYAYANNINTVDGRNSFGRLKSRFNESY